MANDNIFSGLRVVDLASFIAGPSAAVILSDFGADVIKVEPPVGDLWRRGHQIPPQPQAKEAYRIGLVNEIVPAAELITRAEAILKKIASNAPIAVKFALEAANKGLDTSQGEGSLLEASYFGLCAATEDKKEGTTAFLEKRAPKFQGR